MTSRIELHIYDEDVSGFMEDEPGIKICTLNDDTVYLDWETIERIVEIGYKEGFTLPRS